MLYYPQMARTDGGDVAVVDSDRSMIATLLTKRNELVGAMAPHAAADGRLPPPLRDERLCKSCFALDRCVQVHAAVEGKRGVAERVLTGAEVDHRWQSRGGVGV